MLAFTAAFIRTHREREEAYTRSLEQEALQLRADETEFLRELSELRLLMAQSWYQCSCHSKTVPAGWRKYLSASDEEVFDINIRITNTKEKRRQIQASKPSSQSQHNRAISLKQSPVSPYRTLYVVVVYYSR